ncbi:trypsin-like serine protease [Catenovulum agarivorans]|uniref:trypsin-like serine protease n=1 Tax=Catenovulum agarivorans TaxID=1172192 RepID=UPI0002D8DB6A|nr:trypsin-like serine protease [Catenovulum agarivorans]
MHKSLLGSVVLLSLFVHSAIAAPQQNIPSSSDVSPQIVGGEQAQSGSWPFMTALVRTLEETDSQLQVSQNNFEHTIFSFSAKGNITAELVDCQLGLAVCTDATGKICLIERGQNFFVEKVQNCQDGGGIGAIIFNNEAGLYGGTLGADNTTNIPTLAVSQTSGNNLLNLIGQTANLFISEQTSIVAQASYCGGTYLGNNWVMTAAHCVDSSIDVKANVGEFNLLNGADNAIAASKIFVNPNYNKITFEHDIALIKLASSPQTTASISIATEAQTASAESAHSPSLVLGWGSTLGYEPNETPQIVTATTLRQVELDLYNAADCRQILREAFIRDNPNQPAPSVNSDLGITSNMICAGVIGGGKSACQGDSGGPLMLNTNFGWQQVGIVSHGRGCAADGYFGVYTRTANYASWVDSIVNGVSVQSLINVGAAGLDSPFEFEVELDNNSNSVVNLDFSLNGSNQYQLGQHNCHDLQPTQSCQLTIRFLANQIGEQQTELSINTNSTVPANKALLSATTIAVAEQFKSTPNQPEKLLTWYSGGDTIWSYNQVLDQFESGDIDNLQQSILMAEFEGAGVLSFDWAVASEENVDEPFNPFDVLEVYVNGKKIDFISGLVDFDVVLVNVADPGTNRVSWIYRKDPFEAMFDDKGYLKNIVFRPKAVVEPEPTPDPAPEPNPSNNQGKKGGTIGYWLLGVLIMLFWRHSGLKTAQPFAQ